MFSSELFMFPPPLLVSFSWCRRRLTTEALCNLQQPPSPPRPPSCRLGFIHSLAEHLFPFLREFPLFFPSFYIYIYVCVCEFVCMSVFMHVSVCMYINACMCVSVCMNGWMSVWWVCVHMWVRISNIYTYNICAWTRVCVVYVYVYVLCTLGVYAWVRVYVCIY